MPAFVPQCQYDVFISYAQVAEKEWMPGFREKLQEHLDRELHQDKAASIFWDRNELAGDSSLTAEITQALSNTATLLIVLSKAYLDRPWCQRERESFFNEFKTSSRRAFLVLLEDVPKEEYPPDIKALEVLGFKFWEQQPESDKQGINWPLPLDGVPFDARMRELAAAVATRLKALKKEFAQVGQPVGATRSRLAGAKVFLADGVSGPPAKDVEEARSNVRNWLTDQSAVVLPEQNGSLYETFYVDRTQCEADFDKLVKEATIFVQLLGRKGDDEDYESWLCERAKAAGKIPGKDLLLWRSMSLTEGSITSEKHRALVFSEQYQVIKCDLSAFQPLLAERIEAVAIAQTLLAAAAGTPGAPHPQTRGLVIIDNDDRDAMLADQLRLDLERNGIGYYSVLDFDEFSQMALHDTVDGVVFTFGNCESQWVRKRYQATRPLWLNKKSRPRIGVLRGKTDRPLLANVDYIFVINANDQADIEMFAQRVREVVK
jgi:hypothetical protein